jgi:DNA (cytosine-5)-methyltransferase 1
MLSVATKKKKPDQGDLYHRPRQFSKDDAVWRRHFVERVRSDPDLFPAVSAKATLEQVRGFVDDGISYLRQISSIVSALYSTPDLGNKNDPVDELVYIILSRKTYEESYQRAYESLKTAFRTWDDLLDAPRKKIRKLVSFSGLAEKKTTSLLGALSRLRDEFGSCTLEPARDWPDKKLADFLCSFPEIQRKSAYCVMMYAMGRKVLPVDTHVGRVLTRLRPYKELGLRLDGLDHKQLQGVLDELVPPDLRHSLHVNLVVHGRNVCQSRKPDCGNCAIRKFCGGWRETVAKIAASSDAATYADLFAGAGGLSQGFERAGFRPVFAVECDPLAARTYWLNHPRMQEGKLVIQDLREISDRDLRYLTRGMALDVLAAAPPCQGYSSAGFRSKKSLLGYRPDLDKRNYLFEEVIRAAKILKPKIVLIENVPGMTSARKQEESFLEIAGSRLRELGFETTTWRLNAAAFGVPQVRIRYFLVASRIGMQPVQPAGEYRDEVNREQDDYALPPIVLDEAIFDLPSLKADSGEVVQMGRPVGTEREAKEYRRFLAKFSLLTTTGLIYNHRARYNNRSDLELYSLLRPGEDSIHAIERHGRGDLMKYRRDVFDDKYARLRPDRPSKTIVSHLARDGNGYVHPSQVRSITVREAARIQSFDDGFIFCGSPSDQWTQVGNAVPPLVAEAIAKSILEVLRRSK